MFQFSLKQLWLFLTVLCILLGAGLAWGVVGAVTLACGLAMLIWGRASMGAGLIFGGLSGLMIPFLIVTWVGNLPQAMDRSLQDLVGGMLCIGTMMGPIVGGLYSAISLEQRDRAVAPDDIKADPFIDDGQHDQPEIGRESGGNPV